MYRRHGSAEMKDVAGGDVAARAGDHGPALRGPGERGVAGQGGQAELPRVRGGGAAAI